MGKPTSPAVRRWPGVLALSGLVAAGTALVPAAAPAQGLAVAPPALGMALAPPGPGMAGGGTPPLPEEKPRLPAEERAGEAEPGRRRPRLSGTVIGNAGGHLPNQRTGSRHEHVVRDICIGC